MAGNRDNPTPRDAALDIVTTLREAGHVAYFAGGCVRDQLLGLEPEDYDVASDAPPDLVQRLFRRSNAVGAAFGVVLVYHGHGEQRITTEVATFRTDGDYSDGRRPDRVTFTNAKHDAQRRDFTINGLFEDPTHAKNRNPDADADGVIDYVGGRADLNAKLIRAIGDPERRFSEDYLRMLRAVRFAARFGFSIEPHTADAIKEHAPKLADTARERIGDEARRMIATPPCHQAAQGAALVESLGLSEPVFGRSLNPLANSTALTGISEAADYATRLIAWLGDALTHGRHELSLRAQLCLSNDESVALRDTRRLLRRSPTLIDQPVAERKRAYAHPRWCQAMFAARAGQLTADQCDALDADRQQLERDGVGLAPDPLLRGDDLIAAGFTPGPAFKTVLDAVYDAQLEGRVTDTAQALELSKRVQP